MAENERQEILRKMFSYLKRIRRITKQEDIASETKISNSLLSGYMTGHKRIPDDWISTFENVYNVSFTNPFSYTDFSDITMRNGQLTTDTNLSPELFRTLFTDLSSVTVAKDKIIQSQKELIAALEAERVVFLDILTRYQIEIVDIAIASDKPEDASFIKQAKSR